MGKNYLKMSQSFYQASTETADTEKMIKDWLDAMQAGFKEWQQQLESGFNADMPQMMGLSGTAMQSWQQMSDNMMSGLNQMGMGQGLEFPGFSGGMFPEAGKARDQLMKMLGMPALGYSREKQEKIQKLAELLVVYGEAMKAYKLAFAKNGLASVKALKKRISKLEKPIESMRGLYDFWVNVNEDVYAKFSMSEEYQVVYADLVNSQMAVQQVSNELAEDIYKAMNLPTRSEMDALAKGMQQARRENRQLRKQLAAMNKRMDQVEGSASAKPKIKAKQAASKKASPKAAPKKPKPKMI